MQRDTDILLLAIVIPLMFSLSMVLIIAGSIDAVVYLQHVQETSYNNNDPKFVIILGIGIIAGGAIMTILSSQLYSILQYKRKVIA